MPMQHRKQPRLGTLAALVIVVLPLLFAPVAVSADRAAEELADVDVLVGSIRFQPRISYSRVRVSVTGPGGFEVVRSFAAGDSPEVALPGADGLYKYEIRFAPEIGRQDRERLAAARQAGEEAAVAGPALSDRLMVQRGWFSIADGSLVPDDLVEVAATAGAVEAAAPSPDGSSTKAVILSITDGVISDSLCVGGSCFSTITFSDSTLLLAEANTRIKFADTSSAPGFPNRDWEIQANANSSGGGNYLGINDCGFNDNNGGCGDSLVFAVEGGARRSSLHIDDRGRVGFGTSTPVEDLHAITGDTPTLRLEQDASGNFEPQAWDIGGNEVNFFVRDASSGNTLPFRIRSGGAPSSSLDIAASGDVGVGTESPGQALHVNRNTTGNVAIRIENDNADWDLRSNNVGAFAITAAGSGVNELTLEEGTGDLTIIGEITTSGFCSGGCDAVFSPGYEVESIAEHAAAMWSNRHLPAVGPTPEQGPLNLSRKTTGMLNELEKAHIYIERLHDELARLRQRLTRVEAKLASDPAGSAVD